MLTWNDIGFGPVEIEVRRASLRTEANGGVIAEYAQEAPDAPARGWWNAFGTLCSQTTRCTGLPFDPVTLSDQDAATIQAAYRVFENDMPPRLIDAWKRVIDEADNPRATALTDPNADSGAGQERKKEAKTPTGVASV